MYWTDKELKWIRRARRLFKEMPSDIRLYTTDGEITACKLGLSSEINEALADGAVIMSCCYLSEHDVTFLMGDR